MAAMKSRLRWMTVLAMCVASLSVTCCGGPRARDGGEGGTAGIGAAGGKARSGVAGASVLVGNAGEPALLGHEFPQVAAGSRHNCARLMDGRVKCWGQNGGALGIGDYLDRGDEAGEMGDALPVVNLGIGVLASRVAVGDGTACALLHGGGIKCWGSNSVGELGQGDVLSRGGEPDCMGDELAPIALGPIGPIAEIVVGGNHVCVRSATGSIYCWGNNSFGELGRGDIENVGDASGEMGEALRRVDFGGVRTALQVSAGLHHNCAVLDDHSVKCWGQNSHGQLGTGDVDGRGDAPGEMGEALLEVDLGTGQLARGVYAGDDFSCAILADRRVKCWGSNASGQLGQQSIQPRGDVPGLLGDRLPYTDLGVDFAANTLALGSQHACALSTKGAVKCWGINDDGQLGIGSTENHGALPDSMGEWLPAVDFGATRRAMDVTVGTRHSCATLDDGNVVCWGNNTFGQLGIGTREPRGGVPGQLGQSIIPVSLD